MRDGCIPAANGHCTARALATLYDSFLESLGLSSGEARRADRSDDGSTTREGSIDTLRSAAADGEAEVGGDGLPLLSRARVNSMRAYQVGSVFTCNVRLRGFLRRVFAREVC